MKVSYQVMPRRQGEASRIGTEMYEAFKLCFSKDSTEKWVKMFGQKRFEMLKQTQYEDYGTTFSKNFENNCIKEFTKLTLEYIERCKEEDKKLKKAKSDEEKEYQKKYGVKRFREINV